MQPRPRPTVTPRTRDERPHWSAPERLGLVLWAEITFLVTVAGTTGAPPSPLLTVGFALAMAVLLRLTNGPEPA